MSASKSIQFVGLSFGCAKNPLLKGNSLKVLTAIISFLPNPYPSVPTICKTTGLCRKTVFKHLRLLESLNIIKRLKRMGTSNLYYISKTVLPSASLYRKMRDQIGQKLAAWNTRKSMKGQKVPLPPGANSAPQTKTSESREFLDWKKLIGETLRPLPC